MKSALRSTKKADFIIGAPSKSVLAEKSSKEHHSRVAEPRQRGWYSRGYLPHLDFRAAIQAVTFRLADALPKKVIDSWRRQIGTAPDSEELRKRIAAYEDAGHGSCALRDPENAEIVENALLYFHDDRYDLLEWVVMPNHVHVLFKPHSERLDRIVQSWKRVSARQINERTGNPGSIWQREYFDRYIRDESHFHRTVSYIWNNPVKAGLCQHAEDWPFGSASRERRGGTERRL